MTNSNRNQASIIVCICKKNKKKPKQNIQNVLKLEMLGLNQHSCDTDAVICSTVKTVRKTYLNKVKITCQFLTLVKVEVIHTDNTYTIY